ncbi:DUF4272 domain-containing protein [Ascidiaceihabitans sp.]|uniref:DUF4272 domain-containing protein n=1 Tax=Ascidiaceihabitans sp. TaxID=1872644 RepID=UPI003299CFBB
MSKNGAATRKENSISRLLDHSVPYIDHLPEIDSEEDSLRRSKEEVGLRIICLALVSMKGAGAADHFVHAGIEHYDVGSALSPLERSFLFDANATDHEKLQASWRTEAAHVLLWSVGLEASLSFPTTPCDWNALWELFHVGNREAFLKSLELRPQAELLDEADFIYRIHWAVREAGLRQTPMPSNLDAGVVMERHYALNWLTTHVLDDFGWDEVSTNT